LIKCFPCSEWFKNLVLIADFDIHSSNLCSNSSNSIYLAENPSANAPLLGANPLRSCTRACKTYLAEIKNIRDAASSDVQTFNSFTKKSVARSMCCLRTYI